MATNILILPLAQVTVTTGNNEDWIDSFQFVQDDEITPVELTGIAFSMEVRHLSSDNEVWVRGSTDDGLLSVGGSGDSFLLIKIPYDMMKEVAPDDYVGDIVADADGIKRVVVQLAITVFQGITR